MRTTLDLDEDVLAAAKALAVGERASLGRIVSRLARMGLQPERLDLGMRNGFPILPRRPGVVVTPQTVEGLKDELDDSEVTRRASARR